MNSEPWVTAVDVARHLGVVKDTVYRWRRRQDQSAVLHQGQEDRAYLVLRLELGEGGQEDAADAGALRLRQER